MKNLETNRKVKAVNRRNTQRSENCIWNLFLQLQLVDVNKIHQVHLSFEVVGPACQNIAGNHHIRGKKKIAFSYSDPEGTLDKLNNLKPLFSRNKERLQSCRPETKPQKKAS